MGPIVENHERKLMPFDKLRVFLLAPRVEMSGCGELNSVFAHLHPVRYFRSGRRESNPLSHGPEPCMLPIHYGPIYLTGRGARTAGILHPAFAKASAGKPAKPTPPRIFLLILGRGWLRLLPFSLCRIRPIF